MAQKYKFGNTIYGNRADMLEGMAAKWMTEDENMSLSEVVAFFEPADMLSMARMFVEERQLDMVVEWCDDFSHMERNEYTTADLAAAMSATLEKFKAELTA